MRLLFDTHAFIWWDSEPKKLSDRVLALCRDTENELFLSVASLWEMQIKSQLGKMTLSVPLPKLIESHQHSNSLRLLSIKEPHIFELSSLPSIHKDPFDRLLIAQARVEELRMISKDSFIKEYPVGVEW